MITINEQHLGIYEVLIHKLESFTGALNTLSSAHLPITLILLTRLTHMFEQVMTASQRTKSAYTFCVLFCTIILTCS